MADKKQNKRNNNKNYDEDQTKILQELKETIVILNENISDLKIEGGVKNAGSAKKNN